MKKVKRREVPVRHNPGIYKRFELDEASNKWVDTGKFRAIRRIHDGACSRKEQAVFDNFKDAQDFRSGRLDKGSGGPDVHRMVTSEPPSSSEKNQGLTFQALLGEWKSFHYLKLERGTQQTYDKTLPRLGFLNPFPVEKIDTAVIDSLIKHWVHDYPKSKRRQTFVKELDLLKAILNFYNRRKNPAYSLPVLAEHYDAADFTKQAKKPVEALSQEQLGRFLAKLKTAKNPQYYPLALVQFCMGLRIGEACGLSWEALDLENRIAKIEQTIEWDYWTWEARVKSRPKNHRTRYLVIPEILTEELKTMREHRDLNVALVFHKEGYPLNRKTIGTLYNRVLKSLGITHVSGTHMLRKTAATQANEVTGDFFAVSKLLDHSNPNITLRYVSQIGNQKQKVADALNGVLKGALAGGTPPVSPQPTAPENAMLERKTRGDVPQCPPSLERTKLYVVKSAS